MLREFHNKTMKKHYVICGFHLLFLLAIGILASTDLNVEIFGEKISVLFPMIAVLLPLLLVVSWRAANDAPTPPLRNYLIGFRWLGTMFWLCTLIATWIAYVHNPIPNGH